MKGKLLALSLIVAAFVVTTGCTVKTKDTNDVKIIEKPKTEVVQQQSDGPSQNSDSKNSDLKDKEKALQQDTEEYIKSVIDKRASKVLTALKNKNMEELSKLVHPDKGVRFSPYSYVDVKKNLVFKADKVKTLAEDKTVYEWGNYDGSGEPIKLTYENYHNQFVYDEDFMKAPQIGYNKAIGKGNTANNSAEVYKNSVLVEYHFPGFNPQFGGADWKSLRLVFEKSGSNWYLVGIIHDQWTI